jgi:ADP-heptose:LPS heptosyltransferase
LRILLVRLRQIGDVVFTTPALRALREHFPHAHLAYLVEPAAAPVVAASPHLDDVIVAPRVKGAAGAIADLRLGGRLRSARYDLAIDFHGGPRASMLTWLSRARMRIGYDIAGRGWMYTRRVRRPRGLQPRHSVDNQWDLIEPLGIARPDGDRCPVEMPIDAAAAASVAEHLARAGVTSSDRLVVIHVSAGNPFRRWPGASFAEVGAALVTADARTHILVTSGPSDRDARNLVIAAMTERLPTADRGRVLACGELSLAEIRALSERAALFIGGDSGPMHVVSTSRTSIIALYGPTLPARSAPWRPAIWPSCAIETAGLPCRPCNQRVCAPGDFRCLTWIRPGQVIAAAERLLSTGAPRAGNGGDNSG